MKRTIRHYSICLARTLFVMSPIVCGWVQAQPQAAIPPMQVGATSPAASLSQFLQAWGVDKTTHYIVSFADLNTDGTTDAIVYLTGEWCGSGGCTALILAPSGGSWRVVTKITTVRLPIRVLPKIFHGWHAISVRVEGGGIQPGYEAELDFDGKSYPRNPTMPPAKRLKTSSAGKIVIPLPQDKSL